MYDWQPDWLKGLEWTWGTGLWGALLALSVGVVSSAVVLVALVKLPATYFLDPAPLSPPADGHPVLRWAVRIGKNLLGGAVAVLGILLSLPGIPGPGLLLIFIGLTLLDFPGKRRLERKLVERPRVLQAINWLRKRFGKPPLVLADEPTEPDEGRRARRQLTRAGCGPASINAGE
jgi:hypothetical protein